MQNTPSLLDHKNIQVRLDPFPHAIIDNALPADLYEQLARTYPDPQRLPERLLASNNRRLNLVSTWGASEFPLASAAPQWRQFLDFHSSGEFARQVFALFPHVTETVDGRPYVITDAFGEGLSSRIKVPKHIPFDDIQPRATIAINTPVKQASSVRGPHMDSMRKAYVGLFYFRDPADDSVGGDLNYYRVKPGASVEPWAAMVDPAHVESVGTVEYVPNRLFLMLNTSQSAHGVTPRQPTNQSRRLVVVSGWFPGANHYDTASTRGRIASRFNSMMARITRKPVPMDDY